MAPPKVQLTPEMAEELIDLYPHHNLDQLASKLGVHRECVMKWVRQLIPVYMRRRQGQQILRNRPDLDRAIDVMLEFDLSINTAAKLARVPKESLRARVMALRQRNQLPPPRPKGIREVRKRAAAARDHLRRMAEHGSAYAGGGWGPGD